jgi:hypothetical protein
MINALPPAARRDSDGQVLEAAIATPAGQAAVPGGITLARQDVQHLPRKGRRHPPCREHARLPGRHR